MNMCGRILGEINGLTNDIPETFGNSNLAVFKPRFFVEGENQFDCYHFVIPRVEVLFLLDSKVEYIRICIAQQIVRLKLHLMIKMVVPMILSLYACS